MSKFKTQANWGSLLAAARRKAGATQQEVAERMGTQQAAIARLESNQLSPKIETLERYADAIGQRLVIQFKQEG